MRSLGRRVALAAGVIVVALAVTAGLVTGLLPRWVDDTLHATGVLVDGGSPTISPASPLRPTASPSVQPSAPATPSPVLSAPAGDDVVAARLAKRLSAVPTGGMGGRWTGTVAVAGDTSRLYGHNAASGLIPASTMKLLTSTAALQLLGPDHRFTTQVVAGRAAAGKPRSVVLVGGGDPYLSSAAAPADGSASLAQLAAATATALKADGSRSIRLGYDASLFSGPDWNPTWPSGYGDQVSRVSALWVDEGRLAGGSPGPRVSDPPRDAAQRFAAMLRKQGITVSLAGEPSKAPGSATAVAAVQSMPLSAIVGEVLLHSDNDGAEVLLRQAGLAAGHTGSFKGGVAGVEKVLRAIKAWDGSTELVDGSGLSRSNRVSSDQLVRVLSAAASDGHPELRSLITGLPTAAVDGSLRYRFDDDAGASGRGVLRAKTGTLTKVHSLAGVTVTRSGEVLVFAFVANGMKNEYASTQWLEHVTAAVAACGCS